MKRPAVIFPTLPAADPVADPARRRVLKLMAASAALAGTGCSQPPAEKILPYVNMPEGLVPGDPVYYASTLLRGGLGMGILVETESGRPIKIEGNSAHPASLGAADAQAQAAILTLWDPGRSRTVMHAGRLSTFPALQEGLRRRMDEEARRGGEGLRLLSGPVSSPTLLAQIGEVLERWPGARWHVHDPSDSGARASAARQVFGRPARAVYRLERARVVLSVDADLFGPGADGVCNAQGFMQARKGSPRARLYALESTPGLPGALADARRTLSPAQMEAALHAIGLRLGVPGLAPLPPAAPHRAAWLDRLCGQLRAARGACVVAPGHSVSRRAHLLAWRINAHLGNIGHTVIPIAQEMPPRRDAGRPSDEGPATASHPATLGELVDEMRAGKVETLIMLDVNPAYDAPGELDFSQALSQVGCSVHMGLYRDETALLSSWHVPKAHELESWGDARSHDGTASVVQPVIAPIYGGRSLHELLGMLATGTSGSAHERVRATWRSIWEEVAGKPASAGAGRPIGQSGAQDDNAAGFESWWQATLRRGVLAGGPAAQALSPLPDAFEEEGGLAKDKEASGQAGLIAVFANDSNLIAGEYADNAWLQELPRPYSKIVWDNAALISPATARLHGLESGDVVSLAAEDSPSRLLAPVWIMPGQADGVVTLPLGYGRSIAGSASPGHGFDAYVLQPVEHGMPRRTRRVGMRAAGERHDFACAQPQKALHGRKPVRTVQVRRRPEDAPDVALDAAVSHAGARAARSGPGDQPSLYPDRRYDGYAWGMTVDLDACIGCNACAIACQAENNIPVVGPREVALGREMHWMRIDLYRPEDEGRAQFQPMACQHCENAPCEVVCPVGATMHDSEGLNVQVYNRCVGTRFCSNNCPYKVRHFNFFQYAATDPAAAAHANPDVTVRQRGVMEKCTYCVQRISHARIQAQKEDRRIRDGEVVTACQATCPTNAIVFGDLNDPDSLVSRSKASTRNYTVLEELNTRPRTSYLARVDDPAAQLEEDDG
ncbi:MAG TPA: 4Fe-4S dicluster domain-containing protein [Burkholderiaceae bacterium]|nr:4Fe-4S dicluster domain-containing protein [Burkholderiaceae bacterium]